MFLRYTTRRKNGKEHRYYSLVENKRVAGGHVVQRHALYLGEINDCQQEAWRKTIEIFEEGQSRPRTVALFPEDRMGAVDDPQSKTYVIDAPYCIKVEFHESGWVHYHAIFLTRRFLPKELLATLWDRGWVTVQRIKNEEFHYLLKYVTKPDELPAWVLKRKRLRVFQTTKGFLKSLPPKPKAISLKEPRKRSSFTMEERFGRWECSAVIRRNGKARTVRFRVPYRELFDQLVLAAARDGRYKGSGEIIINRREVLNPWIQMQNQLLKPKS